MPLLLVQRDLFLVLSIARCGYFSIYSRHAYTPCTILKSRIVVTYLSEVNTCYQRQSLLFSSRQDGTNADVRLFLLAFY